MIFNLILSIIVITHIKANRLLQASLYSNNGQYSNDVCTLPVATGVCKARFIRYYYDALSGQCKEFTYGGCRGNGNNFRTLQDCQNECVNSNNFDWQGTLQELQSKKALWQSNSITKYLYHLTKSCFCMKCDIAGKYIEIQQGVPTTVQFDYFATKEGCTQDDVYQPIQQYYKSIDDYFDIAIDFVERGLNAECITDNNKFAEAICGGNANIEYDPVLNYPNMISLNLGPMIMDGSVVYRIDCLSVITVNGQEGHPSNYNNECYICSKELG
eukprot:1005442_1